MPVNGSQILAEALERQGVDTFFFIMGAPMLLAEKACIAKGMRPVDVRHEQAAAMMAHAYARLRNRPGICMAASGPGTTNLVTGIAHAWADCTPVIALGGSAPLATSGRGVFQECDQLAMFKPCTKWAERVHHPRRIPELVNKAVGELEAAVRLREDFADTHVLLSWLYYQQMIRSRHHQSGHRYRARLGRLHAGDRARWLGAAGHVGPGRVPGVRPARHVHAVYQVGGAGAPSQTHSRTRQQGIPAGHVGQAGAGLSRLPGGRALPGGR